MEGHQGAEVEIGEHVAIDHHEGVVWLEDLGGESNGTGRVERLGLHGVRQSNASALTIGICLQEGLGEVAEREDRIGHTVERELDHDTLEHWNSHDGEHLLGCGQRQWSEPSSLPADQDDRLHAS